jgi:type I restriction enzyme S subunit
MEFNWHLGKLADLAEILMGQSPSGETCNSQCLGVPLLNGPTEFTSHHPIPIQFTIDPKKIAKPDDILFCVRGSTTGRMNWSDQKYAIGRGIAAIRHKQGSEYKHFIRGLLQFKLPLLLTIATGSTFPNISKEQLLSLPCDIPPLSEQKAIAHILSSFDDKIELNRQINETLEAMARAIFKSWFVDFDPVRAKKSGRQPAGMDATTADLFPDDFEESSLDLIPKGWRVKALPEFIEINPKRSLAKGKIAPYLDMKNMPTQGHRPDDWIDRPFGSGTKFINGDTLMARITPCLENGKTAFVDFLQNEQVGWGSTEYIIFRSKPPLPLEFAYYLARYEEFKIFAIQNMTGSSGRQRTPADCFYQYLMAVPSEQVALKFGDLVQPLMVMISANGEQSQNLINLRDTLLPKLMSGQIRVKEAEKIMEKLT